MDPVRFYIPDKNKETHIKFISNFKRSLHPNDNEDEIGIDELNKSDYLFQTIVLFIMKRIVEGKEQFKERLDTLLKDTENLMDSITKVELSEFNEEVESSKQERISLIINKSKEISETCVELGLFDYDTE